MDIIEIGTVPHEEYAAQLGIEEDYSSRNRAECAAYKAQIIRAYGFPPEGVTLVTTSNRHEFGNYREVAVRIDGCHSADACEAAWNYAYQVEGDKDSKLARWDEQARAELGLPAEVQA